MNKMLQHKFEHISKLVGNTPLVEIQFRYKGEGRRIFAKMEHYNLSGSIKDRIALHILKKAYEDGRLKEGDIIAEATSGNTGISFSALGAYLKNKVVIYLPDWMSKERMQIIESYGAELRLVSRDEGGFLGSIKKTEEFARQNNVFLPCQFSNEDNAETYYLTMGLEIVNQLKSINLEADAVVAGVGTGGTIMGLAKRLKEVNPNCFAYPLEPLSSPTLSTGYKTGKHRIEGISDEFIPSIIDFSKLDDVIAVDDGDAINMSRMLAHDLGIGVGISSGANFIGALIAQEKRGKQSAVVTVFPDDNKKYLSTDYSKEQEIKEHYYSKDIELIGANVLVNR